MEQRLPAQKAGGLYKTPAQKVGRFCSGRSVPCISGRNGHFRAEAEALPLASFYTENNEERTQGFAGMRSVPK